jgi:hypothetical protein
MAFHLIRRGVLALAAAVAGFGQAPAEVRNPGLQYAVILVVRHAEQDPGSLQAAPSGTSRARAVLSHDLAPEGSARAQAYLDYFRTFPMDGQPMRPDCLIAAGDARDNRCPRLTLEPLARAWGLAIDGRFKAREVTDLVRELRSRPHGRVILIAWQSGEIPGLLRALGVDPARVLPGGTWPEAVCNWVLQLNCDAQGRVAEAMAFNENLLPQDSAHPAG